MKRHASQTSAFFALFIGLTAAAGLPASTIQPDISPAGFQVASDLGQSDSMPTVVIRALRSSDEMATVVVTAVKNGGDAMQPLLVALVMMLFGGVLLRLRQKRLS